MMRDRPPPATFTGVDPAAKAVLGALVAGGVPKLVGLDVIAMEGASEEVPVAVGMLIGVGADVALSVFAAADGENFNACNFGVTDAMY